MQLICAETAREFLAQRGWIDPNRPVQVSELSGGVSNAVFRVDQPSTSFVLKQAREQLRVPQQWFCSVERIWREVDVLRCCQKLLAKAGGATAPGWQAVVPEVLREDRANYCYAMTAAPREHTTWKSELLGGELNPDIAGACGRMLATLHGQSWHDPTLDERFADITFFDELRLDPYYRHVARHHAALASHLNRLLESTLGERHALVHGDFSPKNLLVYDRTVMLIDFEVGHYGDPAFDLGFFLTHLTLKKIRAGSDRAADHDQLQRRFWGDYAAGLLPRIEVDQWNDLIERARMHLGACMLARVDGKSRVDYLAPQQEDTARQWGQRLLSGDARELPLAWPGFL